MRGRNFGAQAIANFLLEERFHLVWRAGYRVFNLGDGIDRTGIDAKYEEGVLTIKLFKKDETKPREIEIK